MPNKFYNTTKFLGEDLPVSPKEWNWQDWFISSETDFAELLREDRPKGPKPCRPGLVRGQVFQREEMRSAWLGVDRFWLPFVPALVHPGELTCLRPHMPVPAVPYPIELQTEDMCW